MLGRQAVEAERTTIEEKDKTIEALRDELAHCNEMIESAAALMSKRSERDDIDDAAAATALQQSLDATSSSETAKRWLQAGMSFTEIYSEFSKARRDLLQEQTESRQLKSNLDALLQVGSFCACAGVFIYLSCYLYMPQDVERLRPEMQRLQNAYANMTQCAAGAEKKLDEADRVGIIIIGFFSNNIRGRRFLIFSSFGFLGSTAAAREVKAGTGARTSLLEREALYAVSSALAVVASVRTTGERGVDSWRHRAIRTSTHWIRRGRIRYFDQFDESDYWRRRRRKRARRGRAPPDQIRLNRRNAATEREAAGIGVSLAGALPACGRRSGVQSTCLASAAATTLDVSVVCLPTRCHEVLRNL